MVGIDASIISLMLHPGAKPPRDPVTKKPVDRIRDRIEQLLEDLDNDSERMILPTPALSEFLVLAGKQAPEYLDRIAEMKTLLVRPFDERAAIELAALELDDREKGDKRGGSKDPWQKVKFDRQIVVIAKINGAKRMYSDDDGVVKFCARVGIDPVSSWELPLPAAKQMTLLDNKGEVS
ncbi:MAG TPA: hypothetical protein VEG68_00945 [Terriglobales bacterium]|nr:hypothetical protein [Terriglobales bacterium]